MQNPEAKGVCAHPLAPSKENTDYDQLAMEGGLPRIPVPPSHGWGGHGWSHGGGGYRPAENSEGRVMVMVMGGEGGITETPPLKRPSHGGFPRSKSFYGKRVIVGGLDGVPT